MSNDHGIDFFRRQFDRQIGAHEYALNPFESWALPYLSGVTLDLGCGLGNLALAAARRGAQVTALDACANAVADLQRRADAEGVAVRAATADLSCWRAAQPYDAVVAIGLLMFFRCADARRVLQEIRRAVRPGGVAAVNVLVEGTTYMDMFDPRRHCLFAPDELARTFADWSVLLARIDDFDAPRGLRKRFSTVIARRPAA